MYEIAVVAKKAPKVNIKKTLPKPIDTYTTRSSNRPPAAKSRLPDPAAVEAVETLSPEPARDVKIKNSKVQTRTANNATASLYIANPFKGKGFLNLFATHPPIDDRIKRLRSM